METSPGFLEDTVRAGVLVDEVKLEQLSPGPAEQGRSAALIRGVAAGIAKQGGVLAVSYTHLDVYKRQANRAVKISALEAIRHE